METNVIAERNEALLKEAIQFGASDIHFFPNEESYTIYFQKQGQLTKRKTYPSALSQRLTSHLKFLSQLDMTEQRRPQSGSFYKAFDGISYSFRVSTMPALMRESVVVRIQRENAVVSFHNLFVEEEWREAVEPLLQLRQGLIVITGPTGCGKTTTMYTLMSHCVKQFERHVITLEDPIERPIHHLLQVQVNERAGFTYDAGLQAILRHSPDVIMLGEVRDARTAETAIRGALSGHLVLTTVHSKDVEGVLYRLLDLGITFDQLRQTLVGIMTQRLVMNERQERHAVFQLAVEETLQQLLRAVQKGERTYGETIEDVVRRYTS